MIVKHPPLWEHWPILNDKIGTRHRNDNRADRGSLFGFEVFQCGIDVVEDL